MEQKLHEYQMSILKELLFNPESRFSKLNKINIPNEHFSFHINRLLAEELIIKENGKYSLSIKGKEFANRMDTESLVLERQGKLCIAIHAVRINKGVTEYLMQKRLKEPMYGWYGSHSGKIRWGETPLECAKREFLEETGLSGEFTLKGIVHYHVRLAKTDENGTQTSTELSVLEDKYFWVYKVENTSGILIEKIDGGENMWMTEKEFRKLPNVFESMDNIKSVLDSNEMVYIDRMSVVDKY